MSTKNVFLSIFISILLTISCQTDQKQANSKAATQVEDYILNIYSRYLSMEQEFRIEVTFTNGKDKKFKNLPIEGELFFMGKKLTEAEPRYGGKMYMLQLPQMAYSELKTLEWKQGDKTVAKYQSILEPIDDYQIANRTIDLDKGFTLNWDGAPLTKEEFITIMISPEYNDPLKMNRLGPSTASSLSVVPKQLEKLKPGSCQFSIIKNKRVSIRDESNNLKAMFIDEFHLPEIEIKLE